MLQAIAGLGNQWSLLGGANTVLTATHYVRVDRTRRQRVSRICTYVETSNARPALQLALKDKTLPDSSTWSFQSVNEPKVVAVRWVFMRGTQHSNLHDGYLGDCKRISPGIPTMQ